MNVFDIIKNDYFRLFVKREGKVVLGKNYSNIWLLTLVLTATFVAVAFSNGSLKYLDFKMNDPFINWVDIENDSEQGDFEGLMSALSDPFNQEDYHFEGYQSDNQFSYFFYGKEDSNTQYLSCRFFGDFHSQLVEAILSEDNVVDGCAIESLEVLGDNAMGVIITKDVLTRLGYDKAPAYIDLYSYCPGADSLGFKIENDRFRTPIPVLGVVRRLPGNKDLIASRYFYEQRTNDINHPLNLCKSEYAKSLYFFIPADLDLEQVEKDIEQCAGVGVTFDEYSFYPYEQLSWRNTVKVGGEMKPSTYLKVLCNEGDFQYATTAGVQEFIESKYAGNDVRRLYDYTFRDHPVGTQAFLSVHFRDLNKIKEFEQFVNQFEVKIEMSQINAKENFNAVRLMANILSWAMIAFAIVCILLFIINLLQSYFQKVKRNLGTFKAFGISNMELISVYMLIMAAIVVASIVISLIVVSIVQGVLPLLGILKDGQFNYLALWNLKTFAAIVIVLGASIYTVYKVMSNMLKLTPGDLIYDRD